MTLTIELLCFLGSPFAPSLIHRLDQDKSIELYDYSVKNRMLFLYLQTLHEKSMHYFATDYQKEKMKYLETVDTIVRVSQVLSNANLDHTIFKTIRPYRYSPADIDVLIFGKKSDYVKSVKAMKNIGYEVVALGPRSTTLRDREANIGIDLYEQVAVSFITYMDKQTLKKYTTITKLPNGNYVKSLMPEADLSCIITHSIVKEQMYTLSEYYTFIHYLKQMNIDNFVQLVRHNNIVSAVRTHASITALLHKVAHKTIPKQLQQILDNLGQENFETTKLIENEYETPHKYHPITVAKSLLEIAKGKKCRSSMAIQIYQMVHPSFAKKFLKILIEHITRETY